MIKTLWVNKLIAFGVFVSILIVLMLPMVVSGQEYAETGSEKRRGQPAEVAERVAERKAKAQEKVNEKREGATEKSQEARQKACEKRQAKLVASMERLAAQAERHKGVIDAFYERVQEFYDSGQLTVSNYDELNNAVTTAQEDAAINVMALSELNVEVDCEDPEVVVNIVSFRDVARATRDSLKSYRAALVDLISSLRAEAAEQNAQNGPDTEGEEGETEEENDTEESSDGSTQENGDTTGEEN